MTDKLQKALPLDDGFRTKPFVRVRQRQSPPRLWCWEICMESVHFPLRVSANTYRSAQDAWEAGQAALAQVSQPPASQRGSGMVLDGAER